MIDLHTHSTASDGVFTPSRLVRYAKEKGVEVLALTDHDTISGLPEAEAEAKAAGVEFIPGVELSVDFPGANEFHMLGYFINPADTELSSALALLREGRGDRNLIILEKLNRLGLPLTDAEVAEFATGESVGRPPIARAMVKKGYVATFEEAFERYLGNGKPAYAERTRLTAEEAIALIRRAGGVAVMAHPTYLRLPLGDLEQLMGEMKAAGLTGVEVHYYSHTEGEVVTLANMAARHGLVPTGGSDFHGPGMHGTEVGVGRGNLRIHRSVADRLREAWQATRAPG